MEMVSHIFVNNSVADMFIELILNNNSSRIEETVKRETPATGHSQGRDYKLPLECGRTMWRRYHTLCEPVMNR